MCDRKRAGGPGGLPTSAGRPRLATLVGKPPGPPAARPRERRMMPQSNIGGSGDDSAKICLASGSVALEDTPATWVAAAIPSGPAARPTARSPDPDPDPDPGPAPRR